MRWAWPGSGLRGRDLLHHVHAGAGRHGRPGPGLRHDALLPARRQRPDGRSARSEDRPERTTARPTASSTWQEVECLGACSQRADGRDQRLLLRGPDAEGLAQRCSDELSWPRQRRRGCGSHIAPTQALAEAGRAVAHRSEALATAAAPSAIKTLHRACRPRPRRQEAGRARRTDGFAAGAPRGHGV